LMEPREVGGEALAVEVSAGEERRRELRGLHGSPSPSPPRRTHPLSSSKTLGTPASLCNCCGTHLQ
jgi:hypothetical protein